MIRACISILSGIYLQAVEMNLHHADFAFEKALDENSSRAEWHMAMDELFMFERNLETLFSSGRMKRARGLLAYIDERKISSNPLEQKLQGLKMRITRENL